MKVEETEIEGSNDIMLNLIFEDEDADLYNNLIKMAESKGKTAEEILSDYIFTMDNILDTYKHIAEEKDKDGNH